ncbi:MAG: pitrilysin family protein [Methylophilaceae bacterium]
MKKIQILVLFVSSLLAFSSQAAVKIEHWQTQSGARVYFVENHDLPIVDLSVNFAAGGARDTTEKSGVAGITRYMMTLGAAGLSDETLTNKFADVGAVLGGDFDADRSSLKLRTLSSAPEQTQALDTFKKILHQPDFPPAVLTREKARIIAGIQESETQPESISNKAFMSALYGQHPYARDESGTVASVTAINAQDLKKFYQQHYGANGAVIAMMGDLTREQASKIANELAAGLPKTSAPTPLPAVTLPIAENTQKIAHPASQSHILIGYPGIKRIDPDYFALYVGNYILGGGGFVSRLTEEVREKRGLVYSVYSYFMPMQELGPFQIGLQTKKEQAGEALKVVHETLDKFMQNGVTEKELQAAKDNIIGGFPMRIDSNGKILDYISMIGFYQLPLTYLEDYNKKVNAVTTAQIKEAFNRRIDTKKLVTVIVGSQN